MLVMFSGDAWMSEPLLMYSVYLSRGDLNKEKVMLQKILLKLLTKELLTGN